MITSFKIQLMLFSHYSLNQHRGNTFNYPEVVKHHRSFFEIHTVAVLHLSAYFLLTYSFSQPCQRAIGATYILHKGKRNRNAKET